MTQSIAQRAHSWTVAKFWSAPLLLFGVLTQSKLFRHLAEASTHVTRVHRMRTGAFMANCWAILWVSDRADDLWVWTHNCLVSPSLPPPYWLSRVVHLPPPLGRLLPSKHRGEQSGWKFGKSFPSDIRDVDSLPFPKLIWFYASFVIFLSVCSF